MASRANFSKLSSFLIPKGPEAAAADLYVVTLASCLGLAVLVLPPRGKFDLAEAPPTTKVKRRGAAIFMVLSSELDATTIETKLCQCDKNRIESSDSDVQLDVVDDSRFLFTFCIQFCSVVYLSRSAVLCRS